MCLCLFLNFGPPRPEGDSSCPRCLSCCPLLLDLVLRSSNVKKYTISRKCQWIPTFSTRAFLCLSSHQPLPASCRSSSSSLGLKLASVLILSPGLFFAHVFVGMHPPSDQHDLHVLCLFSQFRNSLCLSLSLFSLCWDRVLRAGSVVCPPCVVSFRYYIEFNDII